MSTWGRKMLALIKEHPESAQHMTNDALRELLEAEGREPAATKAERIAQVIDMASTTSVERESLADPVLVRIDEPVTTRVARVKGTPSELLYAKIRDRTSAISFEAYDDYLTSAFCEAYGSREGDARSQYYGVDAYDHLKLATELFLMCEAGTEDDRRAPNTERERIRRDAVDEGTFERLRHRDTADTAELLSQYRNEYLQELESDVPNLRTLPYYKNVVRALERLPLKQVVPDTGCYGIVRSRISPPCLLELIWSYWQEQGMLVQTMQAVSMRFQNRKVGERNPLAHLEIDPLRPLNNLIWGYIQDEPRRLSVLRRTYEYDHHYGLRLQGKAVRELNAADSREHFLQSFHNLMYLSTVFFKEEDDKNYEADGFPVLNALKELHLVLAQGAHNQFGDLPWQARAEMLIIQWLLSRDEMREFLGGRAMVPYPEPWMGRVEAMTSLQGWPSSGVTHFRDLAVFGEQILLAVRYHNWIEVNDTDEAVNWAKFWRAEIQAYIHAYHAATGVDLSAEPINTEQTRLRRVQPSALLASRNGRRMAPTQ